MEEIKEELRALYNTEELDLIINCFTGYKSIFSYQDIRERILEYYPKTILDTKTSKILQDLYRIGFIGNYSHKIKRYRWNHKGDNDIILSPEWDIMIHRALQPALSTAIKHQNNQQKNKLEKGQILEAIVYKRIRGRVIVRITFNRKIYIGSFKIKKNMFHDKECTFLKFKDGDIISVRLIDYDTKHKSWNVVVLDNDLTSGA